jgi:hypothetical protein
MSGKLALLVQIRRNSLLVRSPERRNPPNLWIVRDFDLPGAAAHWTVLDVRLRAPAAFVDDEIHGFAAIGATQRDGTVHLQWSMRPTATRWR